MNTCTEVLLTRQQMRFRARKGNRLPGFSATPSKKIAGMYQMLRLALLKDGVSAHESHNEAMNQLRRALPALPLGTKSHRIKPSKSDNPKYRKVTVLKAFRPHAEVRPVDLTKAAAAKRKAA